jgi:hypothetical protein
MDKYFTSKKIEDLQIAKPVLEEKEPEFTDEMKDACLKYVKCQGGCADTAGNEEFIGKGDDEICGLVGITKAQLLEFKADCQARITELNIESSMVK